MEGRCWESVRYRLGATGSVTLCAAAAKSLQSCPTVRPQKWQPTRLPHPWDSPGKNTGVGCHFLLQCMNMKSESEVAHSCPTLRDPIDFSLPGSSVHGIFQARVLEWVAIRSCINLLTIDFCTIGYHSYQKKETFLATKMDAGNFSISTHIHFGNFFKVKNPI